MSDKKIIDMDDLVLDNVSLDDLVSLPNVPDAANDWKHKSDAASAPSVNSVDELDISSVDFSVLDPERDEAPDPYGSGAPYVGNRFERAAEQPAPQPVPEKPSYAMPAGGINVERITPPTGGINVEKFVPPTGGINVEKITPSAGGISVEKTAAPSGGINVDKLSSDIPGLDFELPKLKKVSADIDADLPPLKSVSVPKAEDSDLPPLKPVSVPKAEDSDLPPLKPVSVPKAEDSDLPPLKPVSVPKADDSGLPPLKPVSTPKTDDSGLPPLKPVSTPKADDSGLPPLKPVSVGKKSVEAAPEETKAAAAEPDIEFDRPQRARGEEPLPADMSDVVAPKLDDMMEFKTKKADFEQPENSVEGMANPFENANMSAARRKKLEQGFDEPIVMKKMDPSTYMEIEQNERMERISKGRSSVMAIAIIYCIFSVCGFLGDISVNGAIALAIDIVFGVYLFKGSRKVRMWYIIWGFIDGILGVVGVATILTAAKALGITLEIMDWVNIISSAVQLLYFLVSAILLLANKNIREYFESL
ncbi:MAG: hypothetical protein PUK49_06730 [Oscillospiraceae bacterium]|nr:hypothetical protein [Oscillospiraceae bacterium]